MLFPIGVEMAAAPSLETKAIERMTKSKKTLTAVLEAMHWTIPPIVNKDPDVDRSTPAV